MLRKARIILVLISLSVCLCLMSTTYSRYVAESSSNIDAPFAKWQILVNTADISGSSSSTIEFTPIVEENQNVKSNVIAPSSKGYFDIAIDPSNVEVSFSYSITLGIVTENIPDLIITKYSILPSNYIEGDPIESIDLVDNVISNSMYFDNNTPNFQFNNFTIRVFFEWYEGESELMDDDDDTGTGNTAATLNTTLNMNASITFEQIFE